jgi:hypothetical protein
MDIGLTGSSATLAMDAQATRPCASSVFLRLVDEVAQLYIDVLPPGEWKQLERTIWMKGQGSEFGWRWG